MNKRLSYTGVVLNANAWQKEFGDASNNEIQISNNHNISEIIFTLSKTEFMRIEKMTSITCDFEDIHQYNVRANIHTIHQIKGKHGMYAIRLNVNSEHSLLLESGMLTNVNIEVSNTTSNNMKTECVNKI